MSNLLVYFISVERIMKRRVKGIFITNWINAQSTPFGWYIKRIHYIKKKKKKKPSQAPSEDTLKIEAGPCQRPGTEPCWSSNLHEITIGHSYRHWSYLLLYKGRLRHGYLRNIQNKNLMMSGGRGGNCSRSYFLAYNVSCGINSVDLGQRAFVHSKTTLKPEELEDYQTDYIQETH